MGNQLTKNKRQSSDGSANKPTAALCRSSSSTFSSLTIPPDVLQVMETFLENSASANSNSETAAVNYTKAEQLKERLFQSTDSALFFANLLKSSSGGSGGISNTEGPATALSSADIATGGSRPPELSSHEKDFLVAKIMQSADVQLSSSDGVDKNNSKQLVSNIFTSNDWFLAGEIMNEDVNTNLNVNDVFKSEQQIATPALNGSSSNTKKTDWNALYQSKLPAKQQKAATFPTAVSISAQNTANQLAASLAVGQKPNAVVPTPGDSISINIPPRTKPTPPTTNRRRRGNRYRAADDPETRNYVDEPRPQDVLLGRGGRTNNHDGNQRYLCAKAVLQPRYLAAIKPDKTAISQELVDAVTKWGGRFLKQDKNHPERWYEVSDQVARKKASQTLREINTAENRRKKRSKYTYTKNARRSQPAR